MTLRQLTIGGGSVPAEIAKPRAGCIGRVQSLINDLPWHTAGEIAKLVDETSASVSSALNKLKHEGRAVYEEGLGERGGMVWASPESAASPLGVGRQAALRWLRNEADRKMTDAQDEKAVRRLKRMGAEAGEIDWRPAERIPEDLYAL